jgi:hypothetical protein
VSREPGIFDRLLDLPGETDPRAATFARGLVLGALVGAAIAGSTLWQRRHARTTATPGRQERDARAAAGSLNPRETSASD